MFLFLTISQNSYLSMCCVDCEKFCHNLLKDVLFMALKKFSIIIMTYVNVFYKYLADNLCNKYYT